MLRPETLSAFHVMHGHQGRIEKKHQQFNLFSHPYSRGKT